MILLPFICLGIGIVLGLTVKGKRFLKTSDMVSTVALVLLMVCIGMGIGIDEKILQEFPKIGFNCVVISISAITFSVLFTVICEKTVLPLRNYRQEPVSPASEDIDIQEKKTSSLVWIIPVSLVLGLIGGLFLKNIIQASLIDKSFTAALIILYICVGVSQGANKDSLRYLRAFGFRILWLPAAILCGSIVGGAVPALFLNVPVDISVIAASGMSFYSITGIYMSQTYGLALGTYGFIVNVLREFFTVLTLPLLIKISKGSPIAGGAAGDMDTMLAPITKFVGTELGLVTLMTGTILTFIVPILLPILAGIFG